VATYFKTKIDTAWLRIEQLIARTKADRLTLGQLFLKLRDLYSDRDSGGHRLSSGHGSFEAEIVKRGYRPRTVRQWIGDFEVHQTGSPTSSEKRKTSRQRKTSAKATADLFNGIQGAALTRFAALLPYKAAQSAYREAAKLFHPDHGGDGEKMQELNSLWDEVEPYYTGDRETS
jgi:hypothetical protein